MEIRINIPKEVIKNDVPQSKKEDVVENRYYNENGEWMENEKYGKVRYYVERRMERCRSGII